MKTSESWLKEIHRLRRQHTANFNHGNWGTNDTIRRKIRNAWDAHYRALEMEAKINNDEFNFFIVNTKTNEWSRRSRTMRGAHCALKTLEKFGCFQIMPIPENHPARTSKRMANEKQIQ